MKTSGLTAFGCALFTFTLSIAPLVSTAQTTLYAAPTPVPVSYPDFASMNFLIGTWTCTQPWRGSTRTETDVYTIGRDRMWMVDAVTSPPFDQYRTVPRNGTMLMTYDPPIGQWVAIYYDNLGAYAIESTSGWQGNVASWSGKGLDGRAFSDVITKVSDTQTSDTSTLVDLRGKITYVTITCKKTSSAS
jgi:hypothetical protein